MDLSDVSAREGRWISLWAVALVSFALQLWLCQFFSFGTNVPVSLDLNPSNIWKYAYHFPPTGTFLVLNWLGFVNTAQPLNPLSLGMAGFSAWFFFSSYAPIISTCSLLAMAAFLREFGLSRPAALFGGVIYAWQGDLLTFVYPGHFGYITSWPFYAIGAWGALRAERTGHWAYPLISGASCGIMVGLLTNADRGAIASALIGLLYLASIGRGLLAGEAGAVILRRVGHVILCVAVAAAIALAPLLALFQNAILGSKLGGTVDREQTYNLVTQFSLGPAETLTYVAPGLFGWHSNSADGPYWGWIGEWPAWPKTHKGSPNLNLAISTTGTVATGLAILGALLILPGRLAGPNRLTPHQRFFGGVLLAAGVVALVLSWGWHTPLYRPLFALPLMDKWRNPLKWLEMTNYALVVLSAMGIDHVLGTLGEPTPEVKARRLRLVILIYAGLAVLVLGLLATYPAGAALALALDTDGFNPDGIASVMSTMHVSMLVAMIVAASASLVLISAWEPHWLRTWPIVNPWLRALWLRMLEPAHLPLSLALALAALAALQLGWVDTHFLQPAAISDLTATNPLLETLHDEGDRVRVSIDNADPVLNSMLQNQFAAMGISCLEVSAASRIPDAFSTYQQALSGDQERWLFMAGVKNLAVPGSEMTSIQQNTNLAPNVAEADGFTLEPTGSADMPSHALVEMKDYLAKATLVPGAEIFSDDEALLDRLKDRAWNPRKSVLLGAKPAATVAPGQPAADDKVELETYTPTDIKARVASVKGGYLLINDQYDPDWQVEVDHRRAELLRADYILRAVQVPPGDSTVALHYVEHYRIGGLELNAAAVNLFCDGTMLLAWLVAGFGLRRQSPVLRP